MGHVWLAEQSEPVKRQVALKIIKAGHYDNSAMLRFHQERQTLAIMDHPAIAKVFDAGSTPEGQPYFVMEYVPGSPITDYCDRKCVPARERLALFIKVCEGVQHAHQKAIMHRDLKPSNILVVDVDGKPMPRIIDFGIAKAISQQSEDETVMTRAGGMVGTPGYMSPEQADPSVPDVDTRTDVYSLGVVPYELLTGVLPFDVKRWKTKPLHELLRQLHEEDPMRPSTRIGGDPTSTAVAEKRNTDTRQLASLLRGDLDWITLKALEKDRVRRYGTPLELAADLHHYLHNEPVTARPASTAYRLQKYVRRHRVGVVVACGLVVLLAGFAVMQAVQLRRIARERDRANRNAEIAEKSRTEAMKQAQLALGTIYQVVTSTDEKLAPIAGTGTLRRELLESAMQNLDKISRTAATSNWADRTTGVALQRMGAFYDQMGMTKQETEALERSVQIFDRLMGEDPNQDWTKFDAAISYDTLGEIGREAEPDPSKIYRYYELSRQLRQQLVETRHQEQPSRMQRVRGLAISYVKLSALALELHDPDKALQYAQLAINAGLPLTQMTGSELNDSRDVISQANRLLGRARLLLGQEALAREAFSHSELLQREAVQSNSLDAYAKQELARTNLAIGNMELELGNIAASFDQYHKAESIFTELTAKDKTNDEAKWYLANTQYALGNALQASGRHDEAKAYFLQCLSTRDRLFLMTPTNVQRRIELMLVNAQLGKTQDALESARLVEQYAPGNPGKLFPAACVYSLSARATNVRAKQKAYVDEAIRLLRMAIASGFRDRWALQHDPELESVRSDSAYKLLF